LIEGLIRLMDTEKEFTGPVNLGNPHQITVRQLAERVIALTNSRSELQFKSLPADDPRQRQPDITFARTKLGWNPSVDLNEGLMRTIDYFASINDGLKPRRPVYSPPEPTLEPA
jgi:UDP-glucuronate decarboxylase